MAKSANYRVKLRRRREGKTDYQARKAMVLSGKARLVTRSSIKNVNAQIIIAKPIGDIVLAAANSRELIKKYGWKAATGNLPAAYLTGLLCGLKAKNAGVDAAVLDIGMVIPTKGSKVFATLHGVIDAGVEIPHGEDKIVTYRSKGDHIANYARELGAEEPEVYKAKFTKYKADGLAPEKVAEHFSQVRAAIVASFKGATVAPEPESAPEPKAKPKPVPKPDAKAALKANAKAVMPKGEAKAAPTPKEAPKVKPTAEPKTEAKAEKTTDELDAKVAEEKVLAAKENPKPKTESSKAKTTSKEKLTEKIPKEKAEKAPKAKAAKEKAPAKEKTQAKKPSKKGENKE
jgi:large subunit ribosomal protein L18